MDVSSLLGRMEQLHTEVYSMKYAMQLQADVSKNFHVTTLEINHRVCALEWSTDLIGGDGLGASVESIRSTGVGAMAGATGLDVTALGSAPVGALAAGERAAVGGLYSERGEGSLLLFFFCFCM